MIQDNSKISRNIEQAYNDKKYIVTYRTVYQPHYSVNAGYYATPVYTSQAENLTRAGRYFHFTGDQVNKLIGFNLLLNL